MVPPFRCPWRVTIKCRTAVPSVLAVLVTGVLAGCAGSSTAPAAAGSSAATAPSAPSGSGPGSPVPEGSGGSPAAPGLATAPAAGTTLATINEIGQTNVISNPLGSGFTAVHDLFDLNSNTDVSSLQTYDIGGNLLATLHAGSFSGDCGAADIVNKAGRLIVTVLISTTPAQGIKPASYSETMTAWNAATGASVWTASIVKNQAEQISCPPGGTGELYAFMSTLNGQWGVLELPSSGGPNAYLDAIDLTTGKLYPRSDLAGVLGNDVVTGSGSDVDGDYASLTVTVPGSWPQLGTAAGPGGPRGASLELDGEVPIANDAAPDNFAVTGYTGDLGEGSGLDAVATPDGGYLATVYSDENGNSAERGYALPSLHQLWNDPVPLYSTDIIVGVNDSAILIARTRNEAGSATELLALDPGTGRTQWTVNIGGGAVCDLTSSQVLVAANNQLATLSAATGKQLSYESDPYPGVNGAAAGCPSVIGTGLGGAGMNSNNQVVQLLAP